MTFNQYFCQADQEVTNNDAIENQHLSTSMENAVQSCYRELMIDEITHPDNNAPPNCQNSVGGNIAHIHNDSAAKFHFLTFSCDMTALDLHSTYISNFNDEHTFDSFIPIVLQVKVKM